MKSTSSLLKVGIPLFAFSLLVILAAWTGKPQNQLPQDSRQTDTIPTQKKSKVTREAGDRDLDKEIRQLDHANEKIESLKDIDWGKIKRDVEESLKSIDMEKIQGEIDKAMKGVDFKQIDKEIESSLRKIDFDKIGNDIEKSFKESDFKEEMNKARQELKNAKIEIDQQLNNKEWHRDMEEAMQKVNSEEIKKEVEKEMENARREIDRMKIDMELEKVNMGKEMQKARGEMDKAKAELEGYQEMIYSMEKAGRLSTKQDYKIEYKNGELIINGKKQSQEIANKYKKYFKNEKTTITKEDGEINIDKD